MAYDRRTEHPGDLEYDEADNFEKIRKPTRPVLPTAANRRARRSAKETVGSKRVRKSVSSQGGIHRRRQKKII